MIGRSPKSLLEMTPGARRYMTTWKIYPEVKTYPLASPGMAMKW